MSQQRVDISCILNVFVLQSYFVSLNSLRTKGKFGKKIKFNKLDFVNNLLEEKHFKVYHTQILQFYLYG